MLLQLAIFVVPILLVGQHTLAKSQKTEPIYVAILDDAREDKRDSTPGTVDRRVVRPVSSKEKDGWGPNTSLPSKMKWTVAFDGKDVGLIESEWISPHESATGSYPGNQTVLTATEKIPTIGSPSEKFVGFVSAALGLKIRRPLVLVSNPYSADPDGWKRAKITPEAQKAVASAFRGAFPTVHHCKDEQLLENHWKYPDSILSFPAVYKSSKSAFLVEVGVNAGDCGWVTKPDDPQSMFVAQWFLVAPGKPARKIGGFGDLLDAGDYDNDGVSEFIFFSANSEHADRYSLVFDNLQKTIDIKIDYR